MSDTQMLLSWVALTFVALALAPPAQAQTDASRAATPAVYPSGVVGLGTLRGELVDDGVVSFEFSVDMHYRRHALGVRVRSHSPPLRISFGPPSLRRQLWELGGVYAFSLTRRASVGTGLLYIDHVYRSDSGRANVRDKRLGVPVELTLRLRPLPGFGPYVRGMVTFSETAPHGGLTVGLSF